MKTRQRLERKIQLLSCICGAKTPERWNLEFPPCNLELKHTDWQIAKALSKDPRRSLSDAAKQVRASTRTIKRRLERMTRANAFYLVGLPNFRKSDHIGGNFLVYGPDEKRKRLADRQILSKIEGIAFVNTGSPDHSMFVIARDNVAQCEEIETWMKNLEGVQKE